MIRLSCPDGFPTRQLTSTPTGDKYPRGLPPTAPSQRRQRREGKTVNELLDELSLVGYVDEPDYSTIVEPSGNSDLISCCFYYTDQIVSGTFYVHFGCVGWSTGVSRTLTGVGSPKIEGAWPVIEVSLTRRCAFCSRLGASLACSYRHNEETCSLYFHYPCAVASSGFLEPHDRSFVCNLHLDQITLLRKF